MSTPMILLPGMMCDDRLFAPIVSGLSVKREVICCPLTNGNSIAEIASGLLAITPPTFALAGLSMGGIVAMEMIRQAPARIERIALIDTNHLADPIDRKVTRSRQIHAVQSGQLQRIMRDEMKPHYLSDGPDRQQILDLCMSMALDLGDDVFISQSEALANRPDYTGTLKRIAVPTLVMCGEHDTLCTPERHRLMHTLIPRSELVVVKQAGHLVVLEQPDRSVKALLEWLGSVRV